MEILGLQNLNEKYIEDIKKLEKICKEYEGLNGDAFLSNELNFNKDIKCYFLLYEGEILVSFIYMFMPSPVEAEISACTLPEHRHKGYFKILLEKAVDELIKYNVHEILFVQEPGSREAKIVLDKLRAKHEFTEYLLYYEGNMPAKSMELKTVTEESMAEVIKLNVDIFNDSLSVSESMVREAVNSNKITPYMVMQNGEIIGVCNVNFESEDISIFGLGIAPKYQGKGLGRAMLESLINQLMTEENKSITLEVNSQNNRAYNLYISSGFKIRTQFDYYRMNIMDMKIKKAQKSEADTIMAVITNAVIDMEAEGIHEWDSIYPNIDVIKKDIDEGNLYVYLDEGIIKGIMVLNEFQDEEYKSVKWQQEQGRNLIIHRLCIDPSFKGQGLATKLVKFAEKFGRSNNYQSIRLDAFTKNQHALKLYEKNDYQLRGTVNFRKGEFCCFEKVL
ncbi:MAG: GNAT family N-acetyltransferase [Bacillota bacterium]|nr:GNAT family N-acetyltransferase [Bacillota bacterium]